MNMDENNNHINYRLGEQLPSHSPDPGAWQRLSAKLDILDAETAYQQKLQDLPVHTPDQGTWNIISSRLNRIAYYKTSVRIALSVAAGLLLFFTVSRISDQYQPSPNGVPQVARQEQQNIPLETTKQANTAKSEVAETQKITRKTGNDFIVFTEKVQKSTTTETESERVSSANKTVDNNIASPAVNQESLAAKEEPKAIVLNTGNVVDANAITTETLVQPENKDALVTQNSSFHDGISPAKEIINSADEPRSILFEKDKYVTSTATPIKQYPLTESVPASNKNHVALAMNYLPENIYNGTDNSLFHNVDLTASYNKEKVRFNTSFGMAYNEEQIKFEMNYDINTPVTAMGPGGQLDTVSYNVSNMESEYMGTEKHKYVTYNLGIGRRLYGKGKFSTWLNAGAGFGIKLNEPDLIAATTNSIKGQYNPQRLSVSSSKPVYNDVNVNFVTAIYFNYKILNKLSISFAPTSRWYFKPVLSLNNQATDELTLGFTTGMKFEF
jgi:hypothetical protein